MKMGKNWTFYVNFNMKTTNVKVEKGTVSLILYTVSSKLDYK